MAFWMFLLIMADVSAAQFAANNHGLWILLGKGQNPSQRQLRQVELVQDGFERDFGLSKVQWQPVFPPLKRVWFFSHTWLPAIDKCDLSTVLTSGAKMTSQCL
jgi:hypothetical protein